MNEPDPFDCYVVPDGIDKVRKIEDTKIKNSIIYEIEREDHTVGNLLRMYLIEDEDILFTGYKMPHPLTPKLIVKAQTKENGKSPKEVVVTAIDKINRDIELMTKSFQQEIIKKKNLVPEQYH
eukprot:TRINITY_DN1010_c0_g1_i1.p1 TRINITY_DN1010_c0_g1~~TRINITY_DN1010_c0_g1_i1.p1  ORF type:complete len:123 (+),score=12.65 TRINITY_DN1010_c0_g1_i1:86-454(+)